MKRPYARLLSALLVLAGLMVSASCRSGQTKEEHAIPADGTAAPSTAPPTAGANVPNGRPSRVTLFEHRSQTDSSWGVEQELQAQSQDVVVATGQLLLELAFSSGGQAQAAEVKVSPDVPVTREVQGSDLLLRISGDWDRLTVDVQTPGEPLELRLRRVEVPVAGMLLVGSPHVRYDYIWYDSFPQAPPGDQELQVTFSKPVSRLSVEEALRRNLESGRPYTPSLEVPDLAFGWQDDQHLTVRFSLRDGQPGQLRFSLAGARDQDGALFAAERAVVFHTDSQVRLWSLAPGGQAQEAGRLPTADRGSVSPDGKLLALTGPTYSMGDGWETAAWLVSRGGERRYLGGEGDYLTWTASGLMIHSFWGQARLLPASALGSQDPMKATQEVVPAGEQSVWWIVPEPGGERVALWLGEEGVSRPDLDLRVMDPKGNWGLDRLITGRYEDVYRAHEETLFAGDGNIYWLERDEANQPRHLWRLSAAGRETMPVDVTGVWRILKAGEEIALIGPGLLFNPATGKTRSLPQGAGEDWSRDYWFSSSGRYFAVLSSPEGHEQKREGYIYRLKDMQEVARWKGIGYGFDATDTFYFGTVEQ